MAETARDPDAQSEYRITYEPATTRVQVVFNGVTVADSSRALIARETRLPPVYYLPREDVRMDLMERTDYHTYCPFKGNASYWSVVVDGKRAENAVWSYEQPLVDATAIRNYVAFYRNRMDAWYEADREVRIDAATETHVHGNPLVDWLVRDAWEATSIAELVARLARALITADIPVVRMALLVRTLHPQVMGAAHVWRRDSDLVEVFEVSHRVAAEESFLSSPFVPIFNGRGGIRRRLDGPDAELDFPILRDLAAAGMTDYVAMPVTFSNGQIHALTLATDVAGGFRTDHLGHVHEILPLVSRFAEVHWLHLTARTLLDTYLGRHTGRRVLEGLIKRGDGDVIPAVIWWADLRGSTALTEKLGRQEYLGYLNGFFESTAGVVIDRGGEVLKFIGDAVMAIFPLRDGSDAAERALAAARESLSRIAALGMKVALALHEGEVHYGNVGVAGRLDFTVTGAAVNEVARLEGLSKTLGQPVVASEAFALLVPGRLRPLGEHVLRGVSVPQRIYGLPEAGGPDVGLPGAALPDVAGPG